MEAEQDKIVRDAMVEFFNHVPTDGEFILAMNAGRVTIHVNQMFDISPQTGTLAQIVCGIRVAQLAGLSFEDFSEWMHGTWNALSQLHEMKDARKREQEVRTVQQTD